MNRKPPNRLVMQLFMKRISISVVIPAFNAEATLERALQSVMSQSYPVAEIIVVDDGSVDATREVAERYRGNIRYVRQENAGVSAARNRGIEEASEEWIAFLDADDEWLPGKVEEQAKRLLAQPEVMWICTNMEIFGDDGGKVLNVPNEFLSSAESGVTIPFFPSSRAGTQFQTSGFIVHQSVFRAVGNFDIKLRICEDRDLWWRIALKYPLVGYAPIVGHRYFVNVAGSLTKGSPSRDIELVNVCDRVDSAKRSGSGSVDGFESHAKDLAWSYLMRAGAGIVSLNQASRDLAYRTFKFEWHQHGWLRLIELLPSFIMVRLVRRLT